LGFHLSDAVWRVSNGAPASLMVLQA